MEILISLLLGIIIGSAITYYVSQKSQQRKIIREYESQIQILKEQHQQALEDAKNRSLDGSRAVIKGQIAEQFAPFLPNFKYLPSDARFIGNPIDYIIFNGYTDIKDNGGNENNLELVLMDIKTGKASLTQHQQAIARAIKAGRVRFEIFRFNTTPKKTVGFCIRCKKNIPFNLHLPYCANCYRVWKIYNNPHYKDRYCHKCGCKNYSTLNQPTCYQCSQKHK